MEKAKTDLCSDGAAPKQSWKPLTRLVWPEVWGLDLLLHGPPSMPLSPKHHEPSDADPPLSAAVRVFQATRLLQSRSHTPTLVVLPILVHSKHCMCHPLERGDEVLEAVLEIFQIRAVLAHRPLAALPAAVGA